MTRTIAARERTDEVFGKVVPTDSMLDFIRTKESQGWFLVATRSDNDPTASDLHRILKQNGNVYYDKRNWMPDGQTVPLNLYFLWDDDRR